MNTYITDNYRREQKIRNNRIRRERQLRIRLITGIASFIIILSCSFGLTSILSSAHGNDDEESVKCYTSVMIPFGSTLTDLAEEHIDYAHYGSVDEYLDEVMFINHMDDSDIYAGQYIILPYYQAL